MKMNDAVIDRDIDQRRKIWKSYVPNKVEVLFIAEAPPAEDRYFYYDDSSKHDHLFINLMRVLFPELTNTPASEIRNNKPELLKRFKQNGYLLIDAIEQRIPSNLSNRKREKIIRSQENNLVERISKLDNNDFFAYSIKHSVFNGLSDEAKGNIGIFYNEPIPFPSNGHQKEFRELLQKALGLRRFIWRDGDIEIVPNV